LRHPTLRAGLGLGVVSAVALLPDYPQTVFFTYQLIGLRVVWELMTRRLARPTAALGAVGLGLVLGPLLAAVQLVPGVEIAPASIRSAPISLTEMSPWGFLTWGSLRFSLAVRSGVQQPFIVVPCMLAVAALLHQRVRRIALFYLAAGVLYFTLAF